MVVPYQLAGLEGDGRHADRRAVATLDGEEKALEADVLLPFFGLAMNLGPIADWGLNLERNHIKIEQSTCATSLPGIFAIGDIATYPGKLKLILSGFAEAAAAAHASLPAGPSRRGAALRVFHHQGRAGGRRVAGPTKPLRV